MKKIILVLFIGINLILALWGYAQPKLAKKSISSDLPADVREQIERLYSSDAVERGYAAYKLGEMGKQAAPAIPYLIGILVDDTPLEWKGEPTPLGSRSPTSPGQKAVEALVKIGEPAIVLLIATLKDRDWVARKRAVEVLGRIGDRRAVEPLIATLRDKDSVVRKRAAWALGRIGDQRAVDPLIAMLKDKDEDSSVLWGTAWALGEIKDARAVEPLEKLIEKDPYSFVSEAAREALEKIRGKGKK